MAVPRMDNRYQVLGRPGSRLFIAKQPTEKLLVAVSMADFLSAGINPPGAPTSVAITSISTADPAVVNAVGHGLSVGDIITIQGSNAVDANSVSVDGTYSVIAVNDANNFTIGFMNTGGTAGGAAGTVTKGGLYVQGAGRIYKSATGTPGTWTTAAPHGLTTGDQIIISNTTGTPSVNTGTLYTVASTPTATTFTVTGLNVTVAHKVGWFNRGMTDQGSNSPFLVPKLSTYQELLFTVEGGAATPANWNAGASGYPAGTGAIPLMGVRYKANGTLDELRRMVAVVQLVAISAAPSTGPYIEDRIIPIGSMGYIPRIKFEPNEVKDLTLDLSAWLGDRYTSSSPNIPTGAPTMSGSGGTAIGAPTQLTNTPYYARYRVTAPATAGWVGLMSIDLTTNSGLLTEEIKRAQLQLEVVDTA